MTFPGLQEYSVQFVGIRARLCYGQMPEETKQLLKADYQWQLSTTVLSTPGWARDLADNAGGGVYMSTRDFVKPKKG